MNRAALALLLLFAAPGAAAWMSCSDPALEAPVPLQREPPAYPDAVRATGIEGAVEIALTVLRDGRAGWVRVLARRRTGYFEQAAAEGVRRWRFTPARKDGEPVECRLLTRVRFALTDDVTTVAGDRFRRPPAARLPAGAFAGPHRGLRGGRILARRGRKGAGRARDRGNAARRVRAGGARGRACLAGPRVGRRAAARDATLRLPAARLDACRCARDDARQRAIPRRGLRAGATGRVVLEVETLAPGEVRAARILAAEPAGLFDAAALAIARGSRLSPAYRDARPIAATALLTILFDPERATCPEIAAAPDRPASRRPPPKVTRHGESRLPRAEA